MTDKEIRKKNRKIDVMTQKLEHIKDELRNLVTKELQFGLSKRQFWHKNKLLKVRFYYMTEIERLKLEIEYNVED